jgi:hypothetical protein
LNIRGRHVHKYLNRWPAILFPDIVDNPPTNEVSPV